MRPADFESFRAFTGWRRDAGRLLVALLVSAAVTPDKGARAATQPDPASKTRIARCVCHWVWLELRLQVGSGSCFEVGTATVVGMVAGYNFWVAVSQTLQYQQEANA